MTYQYKWNVYTGDTDYSGLVYAPQVIDRIARAFEELLCTIGFPEREMIEEGIQMPTVRVEADYISPVHLEDEVTIYLNPDINNTSVRFVSKGTVDQEVVFRGAAKVVFTDMDLDPIPVPEGIHTALREYHDPSWFEEHEA